jgi:predicted TIM-barrel fold metal-dependent hydrolase
LSKIKTGSFICKEAYILLNDFKPKPSLVTKVSEILAPKFPVFDAHNHLGGDFGGSWDEKPVSELIDILNQSHVYHFVDLDGGWGEEILEKHLDHFKAADPERFFHYAGVNWSAWGQFGMNFGEYAAARLREQVKRGAEGLKIWKGLGLSITDEKGQIVTVDDQRLDPLWHTAAELELPVTIHVGDPVAFFNPRDNTNERYDELIVHPDWQFPNPPFPSFLSIISSFARLVARHPKTTFIGAHVGCYAENLTWVGQLLDQCPNLYIDFAARLAELGRKPYTSRKFFIDYADRILFGIDLPAHIETYQLHYRFLETDDEYFNYDLVNPPRQGRWAIYGLYLPNDVLQKIYSGNAERIILKRRRKFS